MEAFSDEYLSRLADDMQASVLQAAARRLPEVFAGDERQEALWQCLRAGVAALLTSASAQAPEGLDTLAGVFGQFCADASVGREVIALFRGSPLDVKELRYLAQEAGYEPESLPGLDLEQSLIAFEGAFLTAAAGEAALKDAVQAHQLLAQIRLQGEQAAALRDMVALLRAALPGSLDIRKGRVSGRGAEDGQALVQRLGARPVEAGDALRASYLNHLYERLAPLSLSGIDPKAASDAEARLDLAAVYTALLTLTPEENERLRKGKAEALPELQGDGRGAARGAAAVRPGPARRPPPPGAAGRSGQRQEHLCQFRGPVPGRARRLGRAEANLARLTAPLPQTTRSSEQKASSPSPGRTARCCRCASCCATWRRAACRRPGERATARHLCAFVAAELEAAALGELRPHLERELQERGRPAAARRPGRGARGRAAPGADQGRW